jgi:superfamily I DNA and RNA helicase
MLCGAWMRAQDATPDYSSPEVWNVIEKALAEVALPETRQFDVLIVDEGQDFSAAWRDIVLAMLKPGAARSG